MRHDNQTLPFWPATGRIPDRPPLDADLATEVCIVGAGIAGLTVGYRLACAGRKAVILEAGTVGGGETERTTAHLAVALDDGYEKLEGAHGPSGARLAADSHAAAIDEIERIVSAEGIDCGFQRVDGYLFPHGADGVEIVEREFRASARAGIEGLERVRSVPSFNALPALRYPRQAQFHPLRYLAALADAFERKGGRLFCHTRVEQISGGRSARVRAAGGLRVAAEAVVIATNTPFNDRLIIHTKQASYRTYALAARLPAGSLPKALYWDTGSPYHYVRVQPQADGVDALIVGGEDHKTGQSQEDPSQRYHRLEEWARARFPAMEKVTHRWSGQVIATCDGLAHIGRNPGDAANVFITTGDCGHGMTHGTIAGLLLPELIADKPHPWAWLYDPGRVRSLSRWTRENLNAAAQYARHLMPGEAASTADIAAGSGAVVRRGLSKIAVYRSPDGTLQERSAICPHLGAVVCWNPGERTWDCPAHGSRFAPDGRVLNGPAGSSLPEVSGPRRKASRPRRADVRKTV